MKISETIQSKEFTRESLSAGISRCWRVSQIVLPETIPRAKIPVRERGGQEAGPEQDVRPRLPGAVEQIGEEALAGRGLPGFNRRRARKRALTANVSASTA